LLRNHYVKELQKIKSGSNRYPVKVTHCDWNKRRIFFSIYITLHMYLK
jgi:hypothetical protein